MLKVFPSIKTLPFLLALILYSTSFFLLQCRLHNATPYQLTDNRR